MAKLMAEAADNLLPDPDIDASLNKDVFDVMLHNVRHAHDPSDVGTGLVPSS